MSAQPTCPVCQKDVIEFTFAGGKSQWYHLIDGMPQPSSPACKPPVKEPWMNPEQKAAEAQFAEMQSMLMPEINYHYNAMMSMRGAATGSAAGSLPDNDASILINASIAWSLLGLLRAKIREGQ